MQAEFEEKNYKIKIISIQYLLVMQKFMKVLDY